MKIARPDHTDLFPLSPMEPKEKAEKEPEGSDIHVQTQMRGLIFGRCKAGWRSRLMAEHQLLQYEAQQKQFPFTIILREKRVQSVNSRTAFYPIMVPALSQEENTKKGGDTERQSQCESIKAVQRVRVLNGERVTLPLSLPQRRMMALLTSLKQLNSSLYRYVIILNTSNSVQGSWRRTSLRVVWACGPRLQSGLWKFSPATLV